MKKLSIIPILLVLLASTVSAGVLLDKGTIPWDEAFERKWNVSLDINGSLKRDLNVSFNNVTATVISSDYIYSPFWNGSDELLRLINQSIRDSENWVNESGDTMYGDLIIDKDNIDNALLALIADSNKDACINLTEGGALRTGFQICNDGSGTNRFVISSIENGNEYFIIDRNTGEIIFNNMTRFNQGLYVNYINLTGVITGLAVNVSYIYSPFSDLGMDIRADPWYLGGTFQADTLSDGTCSINSGALSGCFYPETDPNAVLRSDTNNTYDSEWDTQGEVETIWGITLATDTELLGAINALAINRTEDEIGDMANASLLNKIQEDNDTTTSELNNKNNSLYALNQFEGFSTLYSDENVSKQFTNGTANLINFTLCDGKICANLTYCDDNEILKMDGNTWNCEADATGTGGGDEEGGWINSSEDTNTTLNVYINKNATIGNLTVLDMINGISINLFNFSIDLSTFFNSVDYPNMDTDSTDDFDGAYSSLTGTPDIPVITMANISNKTDTTKINDIADFNASVLNFVKDTNTSNVYWDYLTNLSMKQWVVDVNVTMFEWTKELNATVNAMIGKMIMNNTPARVTELNITGEDGANATLYLNNTKIFTNGSGICIMRC